MLRIVKPRARQIHSRQWIVAGCGIHVFDSTLDRALRTWWQCMLLDQTRAAQ